MKNIELLRSVDALQKLAEVKLRAAAAFTVAHNLREVRKHLEEVESRRLKLVEQYCKRGEDGKPARDPNNPNATLLGDSADKFYAELKELLDLEVGDIVKTKKVAAKDLGEVELEPALIMDLGWMLAE